MLMRLWHVFILAGMFILFGAQLSYAQKLPMPTVDLLAASEEEGTWDFRLRVGFNGSQAYFREWSQGGTDRIAVTASSIYTGRYTDGPYQYGFRLDLRYGQTRQNRDEFRKSEDVIRLRNQFQREFSDERFSLTGNINFESQFDVGYERDDETVRSKFMAPGTLTETAGLSYDPDSYLKTTVGMSLRQTFIRDTSLSERYGLDEGEWFRNEAGFTVIFRYERDIWDNVSYYGFLETFSNLQKSLLNTDFVMTHEFVGQINSHLTANFEFALQYNDDITKALQIKQILSVGFIYTFD